MTSQNQPSSMDQTSKTPSMTPATPVPMSPGDPTPATPGTLPKDSGVLVRRQSSEEVCAEVCVSGEQHENKAYVLDSMEDHEVHQCGYGNFKPKSLQKFHNPKFLLASLCFCSVIQGFVINGLVPISITTLEKRFNFKSTETGLFSGFYDIAVLLVVVPVSYFGNKGHKGMWTAGGMFILGLGSLLCTVPQFLTGPYQTESSLSWICNRTSNSTPASKTCDHTSNSNLRKYLWVFLAGQLLHGIGGSPLYTLGVTYIDENVTQKASPVYLSIYLASASVGPALGFVIGGMFLRIYGDIGRVDPKSLGLTGPEDPRWYGAWWIGFLISGIGGILASIPLFSFGKKLPQQKEYRLKDIDQANENELLATGKKSEELSDALKHLHKHCWKLLRNPTFLFMVIMQCADAFLMNGFVTFVPKVMENLFTLSSSTASMITGGITVPCMLGGTILGGYVIRKFDLKCAKIILLSIVASFLSMLMVLCFLIRCPEAPLAGANVGYLVGESDNFDVSLTAPCNAYCGCSNFYNPVCDADTGHSFYSPCHAGCAVETIDAQKKKSWSNCTCVDRMRESNGNETTMFSKLVSGVCTLKCTKMPYFLIMFSLLTTFQFFMGMPVQQTVLRGVKFHQRSLAMGLQWIFIRLFGSIPGPILFGLAIDQSCILTKEECGTSNCLRYNGSNLALVNMGFGFGLKIISMVALFCAWKYYKAPKRSSSDPDLSAEGENKT